MITGTLSADRKIFSRTVTIQAPTSEVWLILTTPQLMEKWMMPDIDLTIVTDWKVGSPITIRGNMNGKNFENRGMVLQFETEKTLQYSHLSSISGLPDQPESYSVIGFDLQPVDDMTILTVTVSNFPSESIYKHLSYYWNVAIEVLKRLAEDKDEPSQFV